MAGVSAAGLCGVGGPLEFCGFVAWLGLPAVWRRVSLWTGLVFDARSPVRSAFRVSLAVAMAAVDYRDVGGPLVFRGFCGGSVIDGPLLSVAVGGWF